jgi:single-stranded-DNA-specific exonuclease
LEKLNAQRQKILEQMQDEAISYVEKHKLYLNKIIVVKKDGWNEGIIGLVASRLVERYYRPCIVIAQRGDFLKGSARSIPGINITDLIGKSESDLLSFGGHSQAAGLSLKVKKYKKFYSEIIKRAKKIDDKLFKRVLKVDLLLKVEQMNLSLTRNLEKMEPFGIANPRPVLAFENVKILSPQGIGKNKNHVRFTACKGTDKRSCIAFRATENGFDFKNGDIVDIAFNAKINLWNGQEKVDLIIEDVKKK